MACSTAARCVPLVAAQGVAVKASGQLEAKTASQEIGSSIEAVERVKGFVLVELSKPTAGKTFGHLMVACGLLNQRTTDGLPGMRVLDRALKKLKKEKKIVFKNRQWELRSKPAELCANCGGLGYVRVNGIDREECPPSIHNTGQSYRRGDAYVVVA
jgi:hypothetical protein